MYMGKGLGQFISLTIVLPENTKKQAGSSNEEILSVFGDIRKRGYHRVFYSAKIIIKSINQFYITVR